MNFNEYQKAAARTEKHMPVKIDRLMHAAMGLATETGEFVTPVKKTAIYSAPLDEANLIEELGDILWYIALAASALGIKLEDVAIQNIEKLNMRFETEYTDKAATKRADKKGNKDGN